MSENKQTEETNDAFASDERFEEKETYDLLISEENREKVEAEDADVDSDLAVEEIIDTQHTDGHTYNPQQAAEQGLTYTPPEDPATLPSDDPQGAEVGAGFAPSMEESDPAAEVLPPPLDNNDLDLRDDVYQALEANSETAHLSNVKVQVDNGVVNLLGTVFSQDDIALVHEIVKGLKGVAAIQNNLQVAVEEK